MKPGVLFEKNYFLISDWNALISFALQMIYKVL